MASEMPHKFKIGQTVNYHPKDRILSTARGTYTVTGLMPALEGQQREYRIRHFSGRSRMNFGGALAWPKMMTPVLRTRCTKAMNLKAHMNRPGFVGGHLI